MKLRKTAFLILFALLLSITVSAEGTLFYKRPADSSADFNLFSEEISIHGASAQLTSESLNNALFVIFSHDSWVEIPSGENGKMTREQLAYALYSRLNAEGVKMKYCNEDIWLRDEAFFSAPGFYEAARCLHRMGIFTAEDDGNFYPYNPISFGEAEIVLLRFASYVNDSSSIINLLPCSTIPETEAVDDSWFDDVCFIGHSQVVGMKLHSGMDNIDYYAVIGHTARDVLDCNYYEMPNGKYGTLKQGLEFKTYGKIYLMLGINDCPNYQKTDETYFEPMQKILDLIRETQPQAKIYILSLTPVGQWTNNNEWFNPENAVRYSQVNKTLSRMYNTEYLDVYRLMSNGDGYFTEEFNSGDGIHMKDSAYLPFTEYLKTHT